MINVSDLSRELKVSEKDLMNRAVQLQIKLRQRGKGMDEKDAAKLRVSFAPKVEAAPSTEAKKNVSIPLVIGIKDLALKLDASIAGVLKVLMKNGVIANVNAEIDYDTAAIIADELGFIIEEEKTHLDEDMEEIIGTENRLAKILGEEDPKLRKLRPPVITIMGHVDHGKTSLLDAIRQTHVAAGEEGGITQHIGAYQVEKNSRKITFLDTPGHEAFTAMRARGAKVTDIAVLVVAADDGTRPQTIEALNHAKAAGVPIIVAVNKIDKPGADPERVKRQLAEHDLLAEDWGGKTIFVNISAKQKTGIDTLLEMILLLADVLELKANPDRPAVGTIIEAKKTASKGVTATVLIQSGTLKVGEPILVGAVAGRVKAMISDAGVKVKVAPPAMPVELLGLPEVPAAGDILQVVEDERTALQLASVLQRKERAERLRPVSKISLETFYQKMQGVEVKTLNLILKADVQGSVEAIRDSLKKLENKEVKVDLVHAATGDITPADITLAAASDAIVLGFRIKVSPSALQVQQQLGIDVRTYGIIYQLLDDIQKAMGGLLAPEDIVIVTGKFQVKAVFSQTRDRWTLGGYMLHGKLQRNDTVRIRRGDEVLGECKIISLRRESTDVPNVSEGVECGMQIKNVKGQILEGDFIEVYNIEKRKREMKKDA